MKISNKISLSFFAAVTLIVTIATMIFYFVAKAHTEKEIFNYLNTITSLKSNHISQIVQNYIFDIKLLASLNELEEILTDNEPGFEALNIFLGDLKKEKEYEVFWDLMVLNSDGKVIASWYAENIGKENKNYLDGLILTKGLYIKDVYLASDNKTYCIDIATYIQTDTKGEIIGALVAKIKMDKFVEITLDRTGLGKTGEVYLVNKAGYLISPSRFIDDMILKFKVDTVNFRNSLIGLNGSKDFREKLVIFPDYRNVMVIGTNSLIPLTGWSLLGEMDVSEAFESLIKLRSIFIGVVLFIIFVAYIISLLISKIVTKPVRALKNAVEIVGKGDLNYKIGIDSNDEMGDLSRAFDQMTENLKNKTISLDLLKNEMDERKHSEEALRSSEAKYRELVQNANSIILKMDNKGNVTFFNEFAEKFFGFRESEIIGKNVVGTIVPESDEFGKNLDKMIKRITSAPEEYIINENENVLKNGKRVRIVWTNKAIYDENKNIIGILCIGNDITKLTSVSEELKRLASIVESSDDAIVGKTLEGIITSWNKGAEKIYGYKESEAKGKHLSLIIPKNKMLDFGTIMEAIRSGKSIEHFETTRLRKDGKEINVSLTISPILDKDGKAVGASSIARDITGQKRAQEEIRKLYLMKSNILDKAPYGVYVVNERGAIEYVNEAMLAISQDTYDEFMKLNIFDLEGYKEKGIAEKIKSAFKGKSFYAEGIEYTSSFGKKTTIRNMTGIPLEEKEEKKVLVFVEDITERKKADISLKQAKEYAELLYKVTPSAIFTVNKDCIITSWNDKAAEITGYKAEEIIGNKCGVFAKIPCNEACKLFEKEFLGAIVGVEATMERKDGTVLTVLKNADVLRDDKGNIVGGIESFIDITERKKNEEEIKKLFQAIEQSPSTVVITDINGNIEYVNPRFTQLTGYKSQEVIGKNPRVLKSGVQSKEFYKELWIAISSGSDWKGEFHNKKKNGELYWESASISPLKNSKGVIVNYIKVSEDITERKKVHEEIVKSRDFYLTLFEGFPNPIWRSSSDGLMNYFNNAWIFFTGRSIAQELGAGWMESVHPDDIEELKKIYKECFDKHESFEMEHRLKYRDGNYHWVINIGRPFNDLNGKFTGYIGTFYDINERKEAERRMRIAMDMKTNFTSTVSHELRTPLTAIKEAINLVMDGSSGKINTEQGEFLEIAKRNVDRLSRLINDVLDFQKLEAGKFTFNILENDIFEAISEVEKTMLPLANEKGLSLIVKVEKDIPKARFDKDKIIQVLSNIVFNSIKFTEKGHIKISAKIMDLFLLIGIEDTGIGIKEELMPKLFQSFEQVVGEKERVTGGTGLGLAISKSIIERHNGKIWAESKFGKGTEIYFTLPLS